MVLSFGVLPWKEDIKRGDGGNGVKNEGTERTETNGGHGSVNGGNPAQRRRSLSSRNEDASHCREQEESRAERAKTPRDGKVAALSTDRSRAGLAAGVRDRARERQTQATNGPDRLVFGAPVLDRQREALARPVNVGERVSDPMARTSRYAAPCSGSESVLPRSSGHGH